MQNTVYKFDPGMAVYIILADMKKFATKLNTTNVVVGISGGKDSTIVAKLAAEALGKDHVYGVSMPCDTQSDIDDVNMVFSTLGIKRLDVNIGDAYHSICAAVENNGYDVTYDTKTNLPARLRMSALYAVGQTVNGIVLNTCQKSENCCGYATLFGDAAGSYAPIHDLTVTEVIAIGDYLGLPYKLVHKTPIDGLQPLSDEDKLGFTYASLDKFIRLNEGTNEFKEMIRNKYLQNKFKLDIIQIPHPVFDFPDFVVNKS